MIDLPSVQDIVDFLRGYYDTYGYYFVFFASIFESLGFVNLVFPGGAIVFLGAVYARAGSLSLPVVFLLAWGGSLAGLAIDYSAGRYSAQLTRSRLLGPALTLVSRLPVARRWLAPEPTDEPGPADWAQSRAGQTITAATDRMLRSGTSILLGSQLSNYARCIVAVAAGAARYPFGRFMAIQAIGTFINNLLMALLGYFVGENLDLITRIVQRLNVGLVVIILILWLLRRRIVRFVRWTLDHLPTG